MKQGKKLIDRLEEVEICTLGKENLEQILDFQEREGKYVDHQDQYVATSREEFEEILQGKGLVLGALAKQQLIAFTVAYFPGKNEDNLGKDVDLDIEKRLRVAHLEAAVVDHRYRGMGIQKVMVPRLIHLIRETGRFDYLMATAAPYNYGSVKRLLSSGLAIVRLKKKYGGKWRYIFFCPLNNEAQPLSTEIEIETSQYEEQIQLIDRGYKGIALLNKEERGYVGYGKG